MPDSLTPQQVDRAMSELRSHWANQALSDSVRDTWLRLLPQLEQGEFHPALDAWLLGVRARFRPEPGEFMELVISRRASHSSEDALAATQKLLHGEESPFKPLTWAERAASAVARDVALAAARQRVPSRQTQPKETAHANA